MSGWEIGVVFAALLLLAVAGLMYARWANRRGGSRPK
jgi:hypothetical protein